MKIHSKKKGALPNPQKRFGRCEKDWKCVESLKKRIKKSTKPLKDLPLGTREDPFFLKTFLSFVEQKNGFVGIYETFKVSYLTSWFHTGFCIKPLYLIRNFEGLVYAYKSIFLLY